MLNAKYKQVDDLTALRTAAINLEREFNNYRVRAADTREVVTDLIATQQRLPSEMVTMMIDNEKKCIMGQIEQMAAIYEDGLVLLFRYMGSIGLLFLTIYVEAI